jgi:hypothetical protein
MASHEKLKRVMRRIIEDYPNREWIIKKELYKSIILEIGHSPKTLISVTKALVILGYLKIDRKTFKIMKKDYF